MENIGQIYHKYKIYEMRNCDMIKALEQNFQEKHYRNQYKESFLIQNLKFQMKLQVKERLEKY